MYEKYVILYMKNCIYQELTYFLWLGENRQK
jgi:hypothetical protein